MKRVTHDQFLEAIAGSGGVVDSIAKRTGLTRSHVYARIREDEELREAVDDERATLLDTAETHLFDHVRAGKPWAIKYVLSRLGKHRGYTLRHEITGDVNVTGEVRLYLPDNGRGDATQPIGDDPEAGPIEGESRLPLGRKQAE